ncbi:hypothetical protein M0R72_06485 [Candidatus Pacearchaeota archaeon]|jgi:hypothetical protein|nr:hypothetical protein [Candidatus Pacearchaeota archaeon]
MEPITIQTSIKHQYQIKARVQNITDHLLRFTIPEESLTEKYYPRRKQIVLLSMDQGIWRLIIIDVKRRMLENDDAYVVDLLAETEGLKKVQPRKHRAALMPPLHL